MFSLLLYFHSSWTRKSLRFHQLLRLKFKRIFEDIYGQIRGIEGESRIYLFSQWNSVNGNSMDFLLSFHFSFWLSRTHIKQQARMENLKLIFDKLTSATFGWLQMCQRLMAIKIKSQFYASTGAQPQNLSVRLSSPSQILYQLVFPLLVLAQDLSLPLLPHEV